MGAEGSGNVLYLCGLGKWLDYIVALSEACRRRYWLESTEQTRQIYIQIPPECVSTRGIEFFSYAWLQTSFIGVIQCPVKFKRFFCRYLTTKLVIPIGSISVTYSVCRNYLSERHLKNTQTSHRIIHGHGILCGESFFIFYIQIKIVKFCSCPISRQPLKLQSFKSQYHPSYHTHRPVIDLSLSPYWHTHIFMPRSHPLRR